MTENLNIEATRQLLNRSLGQLDQSTLASLRQAREQALTRHSAAGAHVRWSLGTRHPSLATWLATVLVAIGLFGGVTYYWQQGRDSSDVDLAILTDDLPADIYVN